LIRMKIPLRILTLLPLLLTPLAAQPPSGPPRPWSAGVFAMTDSQPYNGAPGNVRVFPLLTYRGPTLELYGPLFRYHVWREDDWTLTLRGQIDFGAYDEDDAPILEGLGDRSTTFVLGVGISRRLTRAMRGSVSIDRDAFNRHEGTEALVGLTRQLIPPFAPFSASATIGLRMEDKRWTRDRVGVPENRATPERPAYSPNASVHPYLSVMTLYRFREHWAATASIRAEWLDDTYRDSPLVSDNYRITGLFTLAYTF